MFGMLCVDLFLLTKSSSDWECLFCQTAWFLYALLLLLCASPTTEVINRIPLHLFFKGDCLGTSTTVLIY